MIGKNELIKLKNLPRNAIELFNKLTNKIEGNKTKIEEISGQLEINVRESYEKIRTNVWKGVEILGGLW